MLVDYDNKQTRFLAIAPLPLSKTLAKRRLSTNDTTVKWRREVGQYPSHAPMSGNEVHTLQFVARNIMSPSLFF